jgi:hypothetical protein
LSSLRAAHVEHILKTLADSSAWLRPLRKPSRKGTLGKSVNLFTQALKKLLAVTYSGCLRCWVLDAESVPFRPFAFADIFRSYWARPLVLHSGPEDVLHSGPMDADSWCAASSQAYREHLVLCRAALLDEYSARLLGGEQYRSHHGWYHNDYWHWDVQLARAALRHVATTQYRLGNSPPSFVEAFARSPTHEFM